MAQGEFRLWSFGVPVLRCLTGPQIWVCWAGNRGAHSQEEHGRGTVCRTGAAWDQRCGPPWSRCQVQSVFTI